MNPERPPIFDVEALLERSLPRSARGNGWALPGGPWLLAIAFSSLVTVVGALLVAANHPETAAGMRVIAAMSVVSVIVAYAVFSVVGAQRQREERIRLDQLEEMVMLRRWPEAAALVSGLLSSPMSGHGPRVQALLYFSSVAARYHQFSEAVHVHDYLLEHVQMDGALGLTVRLSRAMALLREDRLLDADRAISELRRWPGAAQTAGVALVEMYRDVKTGHTEEAIELFESRRDLFGRQLGHRSADAYALAATAYAARGQDEAARGMFERATLLAPLTELQRRYPEIFSVARRFRPAAAPPEVA